MFNMTLTDESIKHILEALDKKMDAIKQAEDDMDTYDMLGNDRMFECAATRVHRLRSEHMGILIGLRLAMRYSESITVDGKLCLDAAISYNDITGKHELKGI